MKNVKTLTSDSWLDSLIESLENPEEAAEYLSVVLENDPETDQLLRYVLKDVVEAQRLMNTLSDEAKMQFEKLDKLFLESGGNEIYTLVKLLKALGFQLSVIKT